MSTAYLIQTSASLVAILILSALALWLGVRRHPAALDAARAKALIEDEFPGEVGPLWLSADGQSAIARRGEAALIVYLAGDGQVVRRTAWRAVEAAKLSGDRAMIRLGDRSAPRVTLKLDPMAPWPPTLGGVKDSRHEPDRARHPVLHPVDRARACAGAPRQGQGAL